MYFCSYWTLIKMYVAFNIPCNRKKIRILQSFGACLSEAPRVCDHFFGTGECFLFSFMEDNFALYNWTGENNYFIRCEVDSVAVGVGE